MSNSTSEPNPQRDEFLQAVLPWLAKNPEPQHGFERWYSELWRRGPCALLRYAQSATKAIPVGDRTLLEDLCSDQRFGHLIGFARTLLQDHLHVYPKSEDYRNQAEYKSAVPRAEKLIRQSVDLVKSLAAAVLAADALRESNWKPDGLSLASGSPLPERFVRYAATALAALQTAWPIPYGGEICDSAGTTLESNVPEARHRLSYRALDLLRTTKAAKADISSWLMLRRLLGYVLEQESNETATRAPVPVKILLVDEKSGNGRTGSVQVRPINEGQFGMYVDPVATGLLLLDDDLLTSLSLGWRCSSGALTQTFRGRSGLSSLTLRLTIDVPSLVLSGNSAGGMILMAMHAAAEDKPLDETTSASFSLRLSKPNDDGISPLGFGDIEPGPVANRSIRPKVSAAEKGGCRRILFFQDQQLRDDDLKLEQWKPVVEQEVRKPVEIIGVVSLASAYSLLTEDARIEEILRKYAEATAARWERERPEPFIEPHYARLRDEEELRDSSELLRRVGEDKKQDSREPLLDEETRSGITLQRDRQTEIGNRELGLLFQLARDQACQGLPEAAPERGARLLLAEDANAGKTVFTYRLKHYFADRSAAAGSAAFFSNRPVLVHRWENRDGSRDWPHGDSPEAAERMLRADLKDAVAAACEGTTVLPDEVVDYALRERRIVLIFDAADQTRKDLSGLFDLFSTSWAWRQCDVVVTGRSFWFNQESGRRYFLKSSWARTTLLGFDENQKARYLDGVLPEQLRSRRETLDVVGDEHQRLFLNYRDIQELLEVPGMIQMARRLVEDEARRSGQQFVQLGHLKTRCDFYWSYYHREILDRAVADRSPGLDFRRNQERWQMMLAVTAFRMVLERLTGYSASGNLLTAIKRDVVRYCEALVPADWKQVDADRLWEDVAKFSALSDHGVLEPDLDPNSLSWRHKGWMEYFLAVFLANYADPAALRAFDFDMIEPNVDSEDLDRPGYQPIDAISILDDTELFRAVLTQITNDPQWYWGWRMASEIPRVPVADNDTPPLHPRKLAQSLGTLFLPPARGIRPTELMYYAFYLFEQDDVTPKELRVYARVLKGKDKENVLAEFRRPMRELLERGADETQLSEDERRKREVARELVDCFMPCPPPDWISAFEAKKKECERAGRPLVGEDLWNADPCIYQHDSSSCKNVPKLPSYRIRVQPFEIQAIGVTRAQYRLFDSNFELSPEVKWGIAVQAHYDGSDGDDNLIVMVNWFDAFTFAKMLGSRYRLPTEAEWEFAFRVADGPNKSQTLGNPIVSPNFNHDMSGVDSVDCKSCAYYMWRKFRVSQESGAVWTWTADRFDKNYYEILSTTNSEDFVIDRSFSLPCFFGRPSSATIRFRGTYRDVMAPERRNYSLGFRLVIVSGELCPSLSSV